MRTWDWRWHGGRPIILLDGEEFARVHWDGDDAGMLTQFVVDACQERERVKTLEEWFDQTDAAPRLAPPDVLAALAPYPTHLPRPEDVSAVSAYAWRAPLPGVPIDAAADEDVE